MKFSKRLAEWNAFAAKACVVGGIIALLVELWFWSKTGIIISLWVILGGFSLYWFQSKAWQQYHDQHQGREEKQD